MRGRGSSRIWRGDRAGEGITGIRARAWGGIPGCSGSSSSRLSRGLSGRLTRGTKTAARRGPRGALGGTIGEEAAVDGGLVVVVEAVAAVTRTILRRRILEPRGPSRHLHLRLRGAGSPVSGAGWLVVQQQGIWLGIGTTALAGAIGIMVEADGEVVVVDGAPVLLTRVHPPIRHPAQGHRRLVMRARVSVRLAGGRWMSEARFGF